MKLVKVLERVAKCEEKGDCGLPIILAKGGHLWLINALSMEKI
jgi:hypothetical protein